MKNDTLVKKRVKKEEKKFEKLRFWLWNMSEAYKKKAIAQFSYMQRDLRSDINAVEEVLLKEEIFKSFLLQKSKCRNNSSLSPDFYENKIY